MAESVDPGTVFPVYPICVYSGICRSEIHLYTDRCRRKGCRDLFRDSNIGLPEDGSPKVEGDCFQCQKCIDTCPKGNIHTGVKGLRGNEFWFTILRAVILLILLLWLGV